VIDQFHLHRCLIIHRDNRQSTYIDAEAEPLITMLLSYSNRVGPVSRTERVFSQRVDGRERSDPYEA
jgi:hypothetical protein